MQVASPVLGQDSVFRTVDAVGDAWSWLVLREAIFSEVGRFDDFQARLGVARSTLAGRLDRLVRNGLLARRAGPFAGVEYGLTESGADFFGCLMAARRFGDHWYGRNRPGVRAVTHLGCRRRLAAVLRCSECDGVVSARQVAAMVVADRIEPASRPAVRPRAPGYDLLERVRPCSVARTLTMIGDRWSALLLREAFLGVRRFDDFERRLDIAPNILTQRLNRLIGHGILVRAQYRDRPVRCEYRLTDKGLDLYPVSLAMLTWGDRWLAPGGPPVVLTHRPCGRRFTAVLTCDRCGEPITRRDVKEL